GVLDPGAQPDEARRYVVALRPARAPLGGGVHAAEARRLDHELARLDEALRALGAVERERDDHAEARHLPLGKLVLRVTRKAGVAHVDDVVACYKRRG